MGSARVFHRGPNFPLHLGGNLCCNCLGPLGDRHRLGFIIREIHWQMGWNLGWNRRHLLPRDLI